MVKTEEEQIRENFHAAVQQLSQMCLDNFENLPRQMTKIREDQVSFDKSKTNICLKLTKAMK